MTSGEMEIHNVICRIQNGLNEATISICESDPGWAEALQAWKSGKNPTDSPEWNKGMIIAFSRPVES